MIIPQFWAEARLQQARAKGQKQITVRRFGWSLGSQAEAEQMAMQRAEEALKRIMTGEKLVRKEPKLAYNGAEGAPIREEVLARHGEVVITRNSYGAHCLNTPDVLFADIDFDSEIKARSVLFHGAVLAVMAALLALWQRSGAVALIAGFLALVISYPFALLTHKIVAALSGGPEKQAYSRIHSFLKRNPEWHLRLYRTPSGLRVLVMHRSFDPLEPRVKGFFDSLGVDPVYAAMCKNQKCFRARVSPKPWRIGIATHMRPRPGVWPVRPEHMENRRSWVLHYETQATKFASCRFLETLGGSSVVKKAEQVCALHDKLSQAQSGREIA